jgi:two-component system sensor histidine kinase BarA
MKPAFPPSTVDSSVLQKSFSLGELLDLDSFRDVCDSYASLFQIGFKIFDRSKELLVDVKGVGADFCAYLFQFPEGKARCTREVSAIREQEIPGREPSYHDCFTGLRYAIAPIFHEGDAIGRLVYGPYLPADASPPDLSYLGERFNSGIATRLLGGVRKVKGDVVLKVIRHLTQTIEVMLYIGYKHALTSRMHVEAVTASYTELQQKNKELSESFERLKELDRLKSNFLATVSHELRTPLTSVIGYSEMLLEGLAGPLTDEQREYIGTIMEKGEQLLGLISSILDFSKIETGALRLNPTPTNVVEVTRSAVSTVMPLARKQGIAIDFSAEQKTPMISADADKIRQVLVNILGNAVKFNRKDGKVSVRVEPIAQPSQGARAGEDLPVALVPSKEEFVSVAVTDTGMGIPRDKLNRIFDSFYQVDGSSTREYGGTGLGLAIARNLVEAHRGIIEVESESGKGSTFTVLLPIEQAV